MTLSQQACVGLRTQGCNVYTAALMLPMASQSKYMHAALVSEKTNTIQQDYNTLSAHCTLPTLNVTVE